jgi:nucleoside-diphosphate-sugar epimerase
MSQKRALIAGITGISGGNLADRLLHDGWTVHGLARDPSSAPDRVGRVAADLTDAGATRSAVAGLDPTHVFFTTWARQSNEAENIRVNGQMLSNLLAGLEDAAHLEHVALVTGLKHYLGPFEAYARAKPETPFREEQPRLPYPNFYYAQEDILFEAAARKGFSWSVHRPHTLIGWALGNAMNMGVTLACYAAICRETGRPFVFPGSPEQYEAVTDVTDARILASQLAWAATAPAARNEAFNIVNGDVFRWRRLWVTIADALGVAAAPYPGKPTPLEEQMADAAEIWPRIVAKHGLVDHPISRLASWWHTDADLGRTLETFTSMTKSRRLGFLEYQDTERSFTDLFTRLRQAKIIP